MLAGGPSAERLLRAHRAGFSQLSQRQLEQLIANPAPLPDMDPSVCGLCGFWVRRCTCRANVPHSAPYVEEDGLLGSLPRELLLLIGESFSIAMLGHLACVSKELRQLAYSECLWSALHAAAPWAPQLAIATGEPRGGLPNNAGGARSALQHEAAVEENWRAGRWRLSRLALDQQCRESERPREVACVSFDADFVILTALDPPTLQLWRLGSLTLAHSLRSRSATRFFCALLPTPPDSPRQLHALSCDCRERHGTLRLWDVRTGAPIAKLKAHASRVLCACFCAERGPPASTDYRPPLLASADEQGRCVLWQLQGCEAAEPPSGIQPRPLAIFHMESAIECLLLQGSLLACGSRDGCVTLVDDPVNPRPPHADGALPAAAAAGADAASAASAASGGATPEVSVHPPGVRLLGHTDWVTHVQLAGRAAAAEPDEGGAAAVPPPQWLCTASRDHSLRVWCVRSRTCLHELRCHTRWINGLAISSYRPPARDLGRLAACSPLAAAAAEQPAEAEHFAVTASADGTLAVWRLRDGRQLATLRGHTRAVTCFQLSGTRVVSASMDRTILAWELAPLLARSAAADDDEEATATATATAAAAEGAVETIAEQGAAALAEDNDAPGGGDAAPVGPVATAAEEEEAPAVAEASQATGAAEAAEAVEVDDTPPSDEFKLFEVSDAHEDFVRCVCFDHHKLLSCADDGRVYLFSFDA